MRNRIKLGVRLAGNLLIAGTANNRTRKKLARAIIEGCGELKIGRSALMAVALGAGITVIIATLTGFRTTTLEAGC